MYNCKRQDSDFEKEFEGYYELQFVENWSGNLVKESDESRAMLFRIFVEGLVRAVYLKNKSIEKLP